MSHPAYTDEAEDPMLSFLNEPTRYLFFTGKGGVGKTSLACAEPVHA